MAIWCTYADRALAQEGAPRPATALAAWTASSSPAYCRDLSGRLLASNVSFTRKFGRGVSASGNESVVPLIHPDDMSLYTSAEAELKKPPHQLTRSHRWMTPQGWRWMSWEEAVLFDDEGTPVAVRAVGHDITRQRLAEELYVKLSRAVEQCPVAIVITDADGRTQYVNPKFTEVSGHTLEECLEKDTRVLREGHPDDESYRRFMELVTTGNDWHGELMRERPDGVKV